MFDVLDMRAFTGFVSGNPSPVRRRQLWLFELIVILLQKMVESFASRQASKGSEYKGQLPIRPHHIHFPQPLHIQCTFSDKDRQLIQERFTGGLPTARRIGQLFCAVCSVGRSP